MKKEIEGQKKKNAAQFLQCTKVSPSPEEKEE